MTGYQRSDGRMGIRNHVAVIYTVKCAEHVARKIAQAVPGTQVFGYDSCYPDPYGFRVIAELAKHPNVAGVLFVKLGCESSPVEAWVEETAQSGKEVCLVEIQRDGGTTKTIEAGIRCAQRLVALAQKAKRVPMDYRQLIVGVECGGSDASSGLAANPATGRAMDGLIARGGICLFSELPELLGTDDYLMSHVKNERVAAAVRDGLDRAKILSNRLQTFSVSAGNEASGLTTIEEKSLGALCKAGSTELKGVVKTAQIPKESGLYLLDKVGTVDSNQLTIYEENDNDGFAALIATGAHLIVFTTGCGNVAGSVVAPVLKVCGNPRQVAVMGDDFDIDASTILLGRETVAQVGTRLLDRIGTVCGGELTRAEALGHEEYYIPRKFSRACDVTYF